MKPRLALVLLAASVAMGYGVYKVKYEVRALKVRASQVQAEIDREKESVEVLQAEWAYLTRPTRLQELADRHLHLGPVKPQQVLALGELDAALPKVADAGRDDRKVASLGSDGR